MKIIAPVQITDAQFVSSTIPETDHAEWDVVTAYTVGQRVMRAARHEIYEAVTDNTGKTPESSPNDWLLVGATNRWAMFDEKVGTVSSALETMTVELQPGLITALTLINVSAQTVRVEIDDVVDGVVFDQTYDMQSYLGITDYWEYCFLPIRRRSTLYIEDLPSYGSATLRITLTDGATQTVSVGALVCGLQYEFAPAVLRGARVGTMSFAEKERDRYGNWFVQPGANSKRANWRLPVRKADVDYLQSVLASLDAVPAVYIGSDTYESTIVYGFVRDFDLTIEYPMYSLCNIEIEGMI